MNKSKDEYPVEKGQLVIYKQSNKHEVPVTFVDGNGYMAAQEIADLFEIPESEVREKIECVYDDGELDEHETTRNNVSKSSSGIPSNTITYNLDVVISVGYRVNSRMGTEFRKWATSKLSEYKRHGFIIDEDRFASRQSQYFEQLLEKVRKIRLSEYNFYRKITDIFTLSTDYDANSIVAKNFFATIQNKFHFAIHGYTAAEIIFVRVDHNDPNLGLKHWKGTNITKAETTVAKNYLDPNELKRLELLVEQFLLFAELRITEAETHAMTMLDWQKKLDAFFIFNDKEILNGRGQISHTDMQKKAYSEYKKYGSVSKVHPTPGLTSRPSFPNSR